MKPSCKDYLNSRFIFYNKYINQLEKLEAAKAA